ncbi:hypothetical protein FOHLNKBM_6363 [Methylobacterium longum]|nr:hypothetical protein FOHLNKBM_6363 [Methylobacterium longum]
MMPECPIASTLPNSKTAETKIAARMIAALRRTRGVQISANARVNSMTPAACMNSAGVAPRVISGLAASSGSVHCG